MAEIAETVSEDYERGFKDGLKSECLKELKPIMVELAEGCTEAIKGITPMLIDKAHLTIKHAVNRWIPCSARLPEEEKEVLVYVKGDFDNSIPFITTAYINSDCDWQSDYDGEVIDSKITHWMPLPSTEGLT